MNGEFFGFSNVVLHSRITDSIFGLHSTGGIQTLADHPDTMLSPFNPRQLLWYWSATSLKKARFGSSMFPFTLVCFTFNTQVVSPKKTNLRIGWSMSQSYQSTESCSHSHQAHDTCKSSDWVLLVGTHYCHISGFLTLKIQPQPSPFFLLDAVLVHPAHIPVPGCQRPHRFSFWRHGDPCSGM